MPTPAERKALLFLAGVIVLGASVRVVRAARDDGHADSASTAALSRQLAAVDSASEAAPARTTRGKRSGKRNSRTRTDSTHRGQSRVAIDSARATQTTATILVDLDIADQRDIESLPRIGPVLATRIIEDRTANGPFGSIEGFQRVRGVGPSLATSLRDRVTFSGTARPSNAVVDQRLRSPPTQSKSRRQGRRN